MNNMKNLLFEVSSNRFTVIHIQDNHVLNSWSVELSNKPELQKREYISDFLVKEGITLLEYSNSLVLWNNTQNVLVPTQLYENTNAESIFKLNFGSSFEKSEIDYNRIPVLSAVLLYTIPIWLKTLFVLKFSGSKIIHSNTAWLNYLTNKNTMSKQQGVLVLDNETLSFLLFSNDIPIINIQTNFQDVEDIIYHVSFAIQNSKLSENSGLIEIFEIGEEKKYSNSFLDRMAHLNLFPNLTWKLNMDLDKLIYNLCV